MASLLDAYIARNPQLGGLLGQSQQGLQGPAPAQGIPAPQPPQQGLLPGAGGAPQAQAPPQPQPQQQAAQAQAQQQRQMQLQEIVQQAGRAVSPPPGDSRPRIDKRETLLNTGLALLAGGRDATMGQALAAGIFAGRQAAAESDALRQQEVQAQQRAQQYLSVFGEGPLTRDKIDKAIQVATINNDTDTLKVMKDVRGQMPDEEEATRTPFTLDNGTFVGFTDERGRVFNADGERQTAEEIDALQAAVEDPGEWKSIELNGRLLSHNPTTQEVRDEEGNRITGAELTQWKARQEAADRAASQQLDPQQRFNMENSLADDFRTDTGTMVDAIRIGEGALGAAPGDPAGGQTLIVALNKLIDAGSVVREGEYNRALDMGGLRAKMEAAKNFIAETGQLPEEVEQTVRGEISRLLEIRRTNMNDLRGWYKGRAEGHGLNPNQIIGPSPRRTSSQGQPTPPPPGIAAPGGDIGTLQDSILNYGG